MRRVGKMVVLETNKLNKFYQNNEIKISVLKNISLQFTSHEFCGIVGPSGSGKTTLLYVLSGLEKPSSGDISIFNKKWNEYSLLDIQNIRKKDISFIFQFYNLLPNLTVFENIEIVMMISENYNLDKITEVLEWVGMSKFKDLYPNQLSGGMQQRVAIARALVNHPKIIFADEPTGNLDYQNGLDIMNLLQKIYLEQNITIIMVTHNIDNLKFCSRKISLLDGMVKNDEKNSV
ncbi:MAG: ABC transporter ATP-binding protein [Candidatus Izemoplasmatales bacterium]|jgi:putative ABC transport system ATP-binding protein|nr:ABC transporter ATP-binding protein [Candidatus Izemoplasmatales bacterium]